MHCDVKRCLSLRTQAPILPVAVKSGGRHQLSLLRQLAATYPLWPMEIVISK